MARPGAGPLAYLITFTCYGTRIHGSERGSVDREHNAPGTPWLSADPKRLRAEEELMAQDPYVLDDTGRKVVLDAIRAVGTHRNWRLLAAHIRTTHVHAVVAAETHSQRIMVDFKAYASRALTRSGLGDSRTKRWSRHGSMRYLWTQDNVDDATSCVVAGQGRPMAVFDRFESEP